MPRRQEGRAREARRDARQALTCAATPVALASPRPPARARFVSQGDRVRPSVAIVEPAYFAASARIAVSVASTSHATAASSGVLATIVIIALGLIVVRRTPPAGVS